MLHHASIQIKTAGPVQAEMGLPGVTQSFQVTLRSLPYLLFGGGQ